MLKKSIGVATLLVASHAYSDNIKVTITDDIVKNDTECSLREAIDYINQGMPEAGYYGCGGKDAISTVMLEKNKTYLLNTHLAIKKDLTLRTSYDSSVGEETVQGLSNAILKMNGSDNLLRVDNAENALIRVLVKEVTLQGCAKDCGVNQGGLIYNNEYLGLEYVKLTGGFAGQGGAIYNVATLLEDGTSRSLVEIRATLVEQNQAVQGAILYGEAPSFRIYNSVFKENKTTDASSANIYSVNNAAVKEDTTLSSLASRLVSSTFVKNIGYVVNVRDGMALNNLTVVGNSKGIYFNPSTNLAYLANSIVLGNAENTITQNCAGDLSKAVLQNNLVTQSDCGSGASYYPNEFWSGALIAGSDVVGECKTMSADADSLLCPYIVPNQKFLGYIRPRILMSQTHWLDSPIVNKGKVVVNTTDSLIGCENSDQRGVNRNTNNTFCDRGAIEIEVPTTISLIGEDLIAGQVAKLSVTDLLGDSDLLSKTECASLFKSAKAPNGEEWQPGCMRVQQTQTVSKGKVVIDELGNITYTPNGAWHGADIFRLQLVTTTTRFDEHIPFVEVNVQIVQEPQNHMESDKIKTSGGSTGILSLLGLFALILLRRK